MRLNPIISVGCLLGIKSLLSTTRSVERRGTSRLHVGPTLEMRKDACRTTSLLYVEGWYIIWLLLDRQNRSSQIRGLRNLDKFITTRVNLFVYPYPPFSIDDDSESDPSSNDNDGNGKPPQVQEQGEASMKRKGKIIILENHNLHRHRHRLLTRQLPFLDPVQGRWNHYVKKGVWIS